MADGGGGGGSGAAQDGPTLGVLDDLDACLGMLAPDMLGLAAAHASQAVEAGGDKRRRAGRSGEEMEGGDETKDDEFRADEDVGVVEGALVREKETTDKTALAQETSAHDATCAPDFDVAVRADGAGPDGLGHEAALHKGTGSFTQFRAAIPPEAVAGQRMRVRVPDGYAQAGRWVSFTVPKGDVGGEPPGTQEQPRGGLALRATSPESADREGPCSGLDVAVGEVQELVVCPAQRTLQRPKSASAKVRVSVSWSMFSRWQFMSGGCWYVGISTKFVSNLLRLF